MPTLSAILTKEAYDALPDATIIGKDSFNENSESGHWYLNLPETEAEKIAFNLQKSFVTEKEAKEALNAEKTLVAENNKKLLGQLKTFQGIGKSAEEIEAALKANRPEDVAKLLAEKEAEKVAAVKSFEDVIEKEKSTREAYEKQLFNSAVQSRIDKVKAKYGLNDTADFVLKAFYQVVKDKDNNVDVKIFEDGKVAQVAAQDKTDEQLLLGFKENKQYLSMFNAGNNDGGGGNNRNNSTGVFGNTVRADDANAIEANLEKIASGEIKVV